MESSNGELFPSLTPNGIPSHSPPFPHGERAAKRVRDPEPAAVESVESVGGWRADDNSVSTFPNSVQPGHHSPPVPARFSQSITTPLLTSYVTFPGPPRQKEVWNK